MKRLRDNTAANMEARLSKKMDDVQHSAQVTPFTSIVKDVGDLTSKLFQGINGITSGAFTALSGNRAAYAAVANSATIAALAQVSHSKVSEAPESLFPVDILQQLKAKSMATWTVDDVQRWLIAKNLQILCEGARKENLDGEALLLTNKQDSFIIQIFPTANDFQQTRFKNALKAFCEETGNF